MIFPFDETGMVTWSHHLFDRSIYYVRLGQTSIIYSENIYTHKNDQYDPPLR